MLIAEVGEEERGEDDVDAKELVLEPAEDDNGYDSYEEGDHGDNLTSSCHSEGFRETCAYLPASSLLRSLGGAFRKRGIYIR